MRLLSHHLHCVAHSAIVAAAVTLLLGARCCRAVAVAVAVQVMASDIGGADRPRSAAASVDNAARPSDTRQSSGLKAARCSSRLVEAVGLWCMRQ